MPTIRPKRDSLDSRKGQICRSWLGRATPGKSAGATLIELGMTLAGAECSVGLSRLCSGCRSGRDAHSSTSRYPHIFCSKRCEQEFIRTTLASLTLEDCIRVDGRLKNLLAHTMEPAV
jgi:hypothetical protein